MKNTGCLPLLGRYLRNALLIDMGILIVVGAICWFSGWRRPEQFFEGVFIAALLTLIAGGASVLGGSGLLKNPEGLYLENRASTVSYDRRIKRMASEMMESQSFLLQVSLAGLLLLALFLLSTLFLHPSN